MFKLFTTCMVAVFFVGCSSVQHQEDVEQKVSSAVDTIVKRYLSIYIGAESNSTVSNEVKDEIVDVANNVLMNGIEYIALLDIPNETKFKLFKDLRIKAMASRSNYYRNILNEVLKRNPKNDDPLLMRFKKQFASANNDYQVTIASYSRHPSYESFLNENPE